MFASRVLAISTTIVFAIYSFSRSGVRSIRTVRADGVRVHEGYIFRPGDTLAWNTERYIHSSRNSATLLQHETDYSSYCSQQQEYEYITCNSLLQCNYSYCTHSQDQANKIHKFGKYDKYTTRINRTWQLERQIEAGEIDRSSEAVMKVQLTFATILLVLEYKQLLDSKKSLDKLKMLLCRVRPT